MVQHTLSSTLRLRAARLDEVKGLLEFLALEPFYHAAAWRGLVQGEYSDRSVAGLLSMRALLRGVMLRRSKADVGEWRGDSHIAEVYRGRWLAVRGMGLGLARAVCEVGRLPRPLRYRQLP